MGLDIGVYKLTSGRVSKDLNEDFEGIANRLWLHNELVFTSQSDGIEPGWYECERVCSFRVGPYSYYNRFRNTVSEALLGAKDMDVYSNLDKYRDLPGFDMVFFTDCDGFIGPKTSLKLYKELTDNKAKYMASSRIDREFLNIYEDFIKAFWMAADHGGVVNYG